MSSYENRAKEFRQYLDENLSKVNLEEKPMKFKITIEEHISQVFEVGATNIEEAMEIAEDKYYNGEFVLEPGNVNAKLMMAEDEYGGDQTEWTEF